MAAQTISAESTDKSTAAPYTPTEAEWRALEGYFERMKKQAACPRLKVKKKDGRAVAVGPDHSDVRIGSLLLMGAMGTASFGFMNGILKDVINVASQGKQPDERGMNFVLSVIRGVQPRDEVEAMLAAQMAAVHMATMTFARRLAHVENIAQQDSAERAFNKLARTFATQMEALKRYRTGGEQKVTVQHVSVGDGGQAIVGNVSHAPGGRARGNSETTS